MLTHCQADESFLADIIVKKFADHLPLYRQAEMLSREQIFISRQLLSQWLIRCGEALKPLYQAMTNLVLQSGNVFADETPVDMLDPGKGKTHKAYMWVLVGGKQANPPYRTTTFVRVATMAMLSICSKDIKAFFILTNMGLTKI